MALIESTKDGRPLYRVRWNYRTETTPDGRTRRKHDERVFRSKTDARRFLREIDPNTTPATQRITVGQLATLYEQHHLDGVRDDGTTTVSKRTAQDAREQINLRIRPYLAHKRVAQLGVRDVTAWQEWMRLQPTVKRRRVRDAETGELVLEVTKQPTSAHVANKSLDTLKAIIRWGNRKGHSSSHAALDAQRLPEPKPKEANPYPPSVADRIIDGCEHLRDAAMLALATYAGLRWSELRALRWSDIDWTTGTAHVGRSVDTGRTFKAPKSETARTVPIIAPGLVKLREWHDAAPLGVDLIFPNRYGRVLHHSWYTDRLPKIREACGIHFDPHELRDTYASILIQTTGIGEAELTLWLGHRSVELTRQRYARLFDARKTHLVGLANASLHTLG